MGWGGGAGEAIEVNIPVDLSRPPQLMGPASPHERSGFTIERLD